MIITEHIEVSEKILASGGFSDTRSGRYKGGIVAVKTLRVSAEDNFMKIRKVSIDVGHSRRVSNLGPSNFARKLSSGTHYPIRT